MYFSVFCLYFYFCHCLPFHYETKQISFTNHMANVRINHALTNDYDDDNNDYSNNNREKTFPFICCKEIKVNFTFSTSIISLQCYKHPYTFP